MAEYYDLDDILAEQQKLSAVFTATVPAMGYLQGSSGDDDIRLGTKLELPFWLAEQLAGDQYVELMLPKQFGPSVRSSIRASSVHLDIHALCPYFYRFGAKYLSLVQDTELQTLLAKCYKDRLQWLLDHTQTKTVGHTSEFMQRLDMSERGLLKQGQESASAARKWSMRQSNRLTKSTSLFMVQSDTVSMKRGAEEI